MADPRRVRWSQLKVGVVGLAAFAIIAVLIFLLTSSKGFFRPKTTLRTYMDDASGIAVSTPVRLNGITIGSLSRVQLTNSRDPRRAVEFTMEVEERYLKDIPVDSVAGVGAANLLGDKFINITKGPATQTVHPGDEVKSQETQDIPQLLDQDRDLQCAVFFSKA